MRYTNHAINFNLSVLRDDLRDGNVKIHNGELDAAVVSAFDLITKSENLFTEALFNPQTLRRLKVLFDVPRRASNLDVPGTVINPWPTADQYANAIQNFINRRKEPWSYLRHKPVLAVETRSDGIA